MFVSYDVWYYASFVSNYIGEQDYFYIADVYTNNGYIVSDKSFGLPNEILSFFSGGVVKQGPLKIPNTALGDGALQPGEIIYFGQIFPSFDKCGADFEIGIPVGAIIVAALTKDVRLTLTTAAIKALQVSLSVEGATVYVDGYIYNYGDHPGVPTDYNFSELIYIAVGRYSYTATDIFGNTCAYSVPAGLYIESW